MASSARRYPPQDEQVEEEASEMENNTKRRKRFQSAFKVPTASNRPSHDHTAEDSFDLYGSRLTGINDGDDFIADDDSDEDDSRS